MRAIVRKNNGDDWKTYLKKLAAEEGVEIDNDDDVRRFDQERRRKGEKKVMNAEWESKADPDARIGKMKNGRMYLKYKAEYVFGLDSNFIIQAEVHHGDAASLMCVKQAKPESRDSEVWRT